MPNRMTSNLDKWLILVTFLVTLLLMPTSHACRLLALFKATPTSASSAPLPSDAKPYGYLVSHSRSLMHQANTQAPWYQLAGQSTRLNIFVPECNRDGFGFSGFYGNTNTLQSAKSSVATAQNQPLFTQLASDLLKKDPHTVLAHLRAATPCTAIQEVNNHPYQLSVPHEADTAKQWVFMANGGITLSAKALKQAKKQNPWAFSSPASQTPETDSYQLFQTLLAKGYQSINQKALNANNQAPFINAIIHEFEKLLAQNKPITYTPFAYQGYQQGQIFTTATTPLPYRSIGKTWMLSNGQLTLIAIHRNDLWYQALKNEAGHLQQVVFASEPTNIKEYYQQQETFSNALTRWQQLPDHTVVIVNRSLDGTLQFNLQSFKTPALSVG
jgi:predicted glutamine amidotransferase